LVEARLVNLGAKASPTFRFIVPSERRRHDLQEYYIEWDKDDCLFYIVERYTFFFNKDEASSTTSLESVTREYHGSEEICNLDKYELVNERNPISDSMDTIIIVDMPNTQQNSQFETSIVDEHANSIFCQEKPPESRKSAIEGELNLQEDLKASIEKEEEEEAEHRISAKLDSNSSNFPYNHESEKQIFPFKQVESLFLEDNEEAIAKQQLQVDCNKSWPCKGQALPHRAQSMVFRTMRSFLPEELWERYISEVTQPLNCAGVKFEFPKVKHSKVVSPKPKDAQAVSLRVEYYAEVQADFKAGLINSQLSNPPAYDDWANNFSIPDGDYHHLNFHGEAVPTKSNTPPAVSLWAINFLDHPAHDGPLEFTYKSILASQAGKYVDPVFYQGPIEALLLSGSKQQEAFTGYAEKAYMNAGDWRYESVGPDDDLVWPVDNLEAYWHIGVMPYYPITLPYAMPYGSGEIQGGLYSEATHGTYYRRMNKEGELVIANHKWNGANYTTLVKNNFAVRESSNLRHVMFAEDQQDLTTEEPHQEQVETSSSSEESEIPSGITTPDSPTRESAKDQKSSIRELFRYASRPVVCDCIIEALAESTTVSAKDSSSLVDLFVSGVAMAGKYLAYGAVITYCVCMLSRRFR
jgi:hypothetical protein